ncbi:DinB family protein [Salinicoccus sp. HZC-1]|uniref:DinB family protein n=1 Tax=Salinicoccus sp. HZC-1 TaxID=3385497 RepID=UPI00398A7409
MAKETLLFQVKTSRKWILDTFEQVSEEDMMKIPEGFKNNIHWQLGHVAGMMELPTAALTGSKTEDSQRYKKYFGYGTSPDDFDDETPALDEIKALLEGQVPRLEDITEESLDEDLPREFMGMTKRYEQLSFMILHESLHAGKIQEMAKLIE